MNTSVSAVLAEKRPRVISVSPQTFVLDAVKLMNRERVGCVIVVDEGSLAGIFTERDVLVRIVAAERDPSEVLVNEVMTTDLSIVTPASPLREAMDLMTQKRHRHLPVLKDGELLGLISIGDMNRYISRHFELEASSLLSYITGDHTNGLSQRI